MKTGNYCHLSLSQPVFLTSVIRFVKFILGSEGWVGSFCYSMISLFDIPAVKDLLKLREPGIRTCGRADGYRMENARLLLMNSGEYRKCLAENMSRRAMNRLAPVVVKS